MTKKQELENLKWQCENCKTCELSQLRTNIVFGEGNDTPQIMIIGEAPGENEDLQSRPFVGRSGKLLDKLLAEQNFSRNDNVYIANMIKCRPPKNRDPKPQELINCSDYLRQQIEIIKPKVILCLGRVAATKLIDSKFKVTLQHGQVFNPEDCAAAAVFKQSFNPIIIGTFHPAAILRNPNNTPLFQQDLELVRNIVDGKQI